MVGSRTIGSDALDTRSRLLALLEVASAVACMHVSFRAFKRFTAIGQREYEFGVNFSPGIAMIAIACAAIWMRRRTLAAHGITARDGARDANTALVSILVVSAVAVIGLAGGMRRDPTWSNATLGVLACALILWASGLVLWVDARGASLIARLPKWSGVIFAAAMPFIAIGVRLVHDRSVGPMTGVVLSIVFGSALAESVFFHGYVQSRLNEAFGRKWHIQGVAFGPGLFITAVLFGFVHVVNTYDYFSDEGQLAWWWGAATASSLYFGLLREKTGSIVATTILHAFINLASFAAGVLVNP